eukprot:jgi/Mesvir1/26810/Mv20573-RA.1
MDARRAPLTLPACRDFRRGLCTRSADVCRYAHPPQHVAIESTPAGDMVTVCADSLRDRCQRTPCRFFHPPSHLKAAVQHSPQPSQPYQGFPGFAGASSVPVIPALASFVQPPLTGAIGGVAPRGTASLLEVCRNFTRNNCDRGQECRFAHTQSDTTQDGKLMVTVCLKYVKGVCERESCKYFHPPPHLCAKVKQQMTELHTQSQGTPGGFSPLGLFNAATPLNGVMGKRARGNDGAPIGVDALFGSDQDRVRKSFLSAGYGLPGMIPPPPPTLFTMPMTMPGLPATMSAQGNDDRNKMSVCRDFSRGKCERGDACRFVHPGPNVLVVDNTVTLCRDATKGNCTREHCRFYHPPGGAAISVCRDATKGVCTRENCRFYHPPSSTGAAAAAAASAVVTPGLGDGGLASMPADLYPSAQ